MMPSGSNEEFDSGPTNQSYRIGILQNCDDWNSSAYEENNQNEVQSKFKSRFVLLDRI